MDGIHQRVVRDLAEELAKPLFIIYPEFWLTGEVPDNWRLANMTIELEGGFRELTGLPTCPQCHGGLWNRLY